MKALRPQYAVPTMRLLQPEVLNKPRKPLPVPYQRWICPSCNTEHDNVPINLGHYRCKCGWHGDRERLLCAEV